MTSAIHLHDQGEAVRAYQGHLNDRLHEHGDQRIGVDGDCGPQTILQSAYAGWFLGALDGTVKTVQDGTIPDGVQSIVANPGQRDQGQRDRADARQGKPDLGLIIVTSEWGAVPATEAISRVGKPNKIIFHHTDSHHPELDQTAGDSRAEAIAFARAIQNDHMHRHPPYIDSGHNFLVTRSGHVLEGPAWLSGGDHGRRDGPVRPLRRPEPAPGNRARAPRRRGDDAGPEGSKPPPA